MSAFSSSFLANQIEQNAQTNETIDTRNILMKELVVTVINEQDTPPVFQQLPHLIELSDVNKPVSMNNIQSS